MSLSTSRTSRTSTTSRTAPPGRHACRAAVRPIVRIARREADGCGRASHWPPCLPAPADCSPRILRVDQRTDCAASISGAVDLNTLTNGFLDWTRCARTHGLPNLPDPVVDSFGNDRYPGMTKQSWPQSVLTGCAAVWSHVHALRDRYDASHGLAGRSNQSHFTHAQLVDLARCIRRHGFPSFPDPNPDGATRRSRRASRSRTCPRPRSPRCGSANRARQWLIWPGRLAAARQWLSWPGRPAAGRPDGSGRRRPPSWPGRWPSPGFWSRTEASAGRAALEPPPCQPGRRSSFGPTSRNAPR